AVPGAGRCSVLVVAAAHGLSALGFQCFLHDLPHGQLQQFSARIAVGHTLGQQLIKLLARPLRCRYSRGHGDASSCRRRQPATLGVLVPSKSASPSRYPASLGLRPHLRPQLFPGGHSECNKPAGQFRCLIQERADPVKRDRSPHMLCERLTNPARLASSPSFLSRTLEPARQTTTQYGTSTVST